MIRWSYGVNQFKPQFDEFTRRRDQQRALRIISISGFEGVELQSGTGRWEALGNPQQIVANFGSLAGFAEFVNEAALSGVSSWVLDPFLGFREDVSGPSDPANGATHEQIGRHVAWFADALAELGGTTLVVRPSLSAWQQPELDDAAVAAIAECWNRAGELASARGIQLALHFDFLSALRVGDALERLVGATDAGTVGFALDTAEYTVAGIDPVQWYRDHADRVVHVQLKNAGAVDDLDEYLVRTAEHHVRKAGGSRAVPRWFLELGVAPELVDSTAMVSALLENDYDGWVVVESDLSPHPPTSAMLNGWHLKHVLEPLVAGKGR